MKTVDKKIISNITAAMILMSLVCPYIAHGAGRRVQIIEDNNVVNVIVVDEKQRLADLPLKSNQRARFENNSNREDFKGPRSEPDVDDNGISQFANLKGVKLIEKINIEDLKRPEDNRKLMVAVVDAIKDLNLKMKEIEATSTAPVINGDGTFTTPVLNVFKNLGIIFEAGLTRMKALAVDSFTVGSRDNPAGITLHDEEGGAAFCVKIKNGSLLSIPGECKASSTTPPDNNNGQGGGGTQITTPPATTTPPTGGGSSGNGTGTSTGTTTPSIETPATSTPPVNDTATTTPSTPTTPTIPTDTTPVVETPAPTPTPPEPIPEPTPEPAPAPVPTPTPTPEPAPTPAVTPSEPAA